MKKLILSVVIMASMVMAANAVTYMRVEKINGTVDEFEVDSVSQVTFREAETTPSDQGVTVSGTVGDYTYVDLGLSVKWATYNVGATKPTEYGDYFAWGETTPKADYIWETYKWGTTDTEGYLDKLTKYNEDSYYGTVDNKTVLEPADDAATVIWGSAWRMPTKDEIDELIAGCTWERVEGFDGSGVNGQLGTSKSNGNKIFLPAAGNRYGTDFYGVEEKGFYWLSSLSENGSCYAYSLNFYASHAERVNAYRFFGFNVRAVSK